ncbi:DNA mismatch repair protein MutS [Nocardia sp. NPDC005366]|uniref:MutS-related protein n=1 Tax=Nocardia sp. NPDC005366 TaxID=3156878 RepID=UPI0033AA2F25
MTWDGSILWGGDRDTAAVRVAPEVLADLNLDQVFAAAGIGDQEAVTRPLREISTVSYRHGVFRDLEVEEIRAAFDAFGAGMRSVLEHLEHAQRLRHPRQRDRWQLDAEAVYCRTILDMCAALRDMPLRSNGLRYWRAWLSDYVGADRFRGLTTDAAKIRAALDAVRYRVRVTGRSVVVDRYDGRSDYSEIVAAAFARFRPDGDPAPPRPGNPWSDMNEVEERILAAVTAQHPMVFAELERHANRYRDFIDPVVERFDAELRFYLGYLGFVRSLTARGPRYCYPEITADFAGVFAEGAFDAALAHQLSAAGATVVGNDFRLDGAERVLVVTGPNQGGKSTFARMIGQLFYLAALGCPVPGSRTRLSLPDGLFTHFVRQDDLDDPGGALAQELAKIRDILPRVTERSVLVLNESFSTTTADDARLIGGAVLRRIIERGAVAVYVTFLEELAELGPEVVSMVAGVESGDDPVRTFRIDRRPPDGPAYAVAVAHRHGLTYDEIRARVR